MSRIEGNSSRDVANIENGADDTLTVKLLYFEIYKEMKS